MIKLFKFIFRSRFFGNLILYKILYKTMYFCTVQSSFSQSYNHIKKRVDFYRFPRFLLVQAIKIFESFLITAYYNCLFTPPLDLSSTRVYSSCLYYGRHFNQSNCIFINAHIYFDFLTNRIQIKSKQKFQQIRCGSKPIFFCKV